MPRNVLPVQRASFSSSSRLARTEGPHSPPLMSACKQAAPGAESLLLSSSRLARIERQVNRYLNDGGKPWHHNLRGTPLEFVSALMDRPLSLLAVAAACLLAGNWDWILPFLISMLSVRIPPPLPPSSFTSLLGPPFPEILDDGSLSCCNMDLDPALSHFHAFTSPPQTPETPRLVPFSLILKTTASPLPLLDVAAACLLGECPVTSSSPGM